jgi:site-specific recombinase XerD
MFLAKARLKRILASVRASLVACAAVIQKQPILTLQRRSIICLRHGFGVAAVSKGIALNMVQKWLGHSQLTTTAIYANAVGEEEQSIAARLWT